MSTPRPAPKSNTSSTRQRVISLVCLVALLAFGVWQWERGCAHAAHLEGQGAGATAGLSVEAARREVTLGALERAGAARKLDLERALADAQRDQDRLGGERLSLSDARRDAAQRLDALKADQRTAEDVKEERDDALDDAQRDLDRKLARLKHELGDVEFDPTGAVLSRDGLVSAGCKKADETALWGVSGRDITDRLTDTCVEIDEAQEALKALNAKREAASEALETAKKRLDALRDDVQAAEGRLTTLGSQLLDADQREAAAARARGDAQDALARFERAHSDDLKRAELALNTAREASRAQLAAVAQRGRWALPFEVYEAWVMAVVCLLGALGVALRGIQLWGGALGFGLGRAKPKGEPPSHEVLVADNPNTCALRLAPGQVLWSRRNGLKSTHMGARVLPPWCTGAPIGRLWHKVYWMDRVVCADAPERVELVGDDPNGVFHTVALRAGERRVVNLRFLMGAVLDEDVSHKAIFTGLRGLLKPAYWLWGHAPPAVLEGPATLILYGAGLQACDEGEVTLQVTQAVAFDPSSAARGALRLLPTQSNTWDGQLINAFSFDSRICAASGQEAGLVAQEHAPPLPHLHRFGRFVLHHLVWGMMVFVALRWLVVWASGALG